MKLIRFGQIGQEKPGVIVNDNWYSVAEFFIDFNETFFENNGIEKLQTVVDTKLAELPIVDKSVRLGSPFTRPSKIVCIGLNYAAHARETGAEPPSEPVIFFKATTALGGPNDNIIIPKNSEKTDWEVELAVVIGKKTSYVEVDEAMDYVAGYCLHNDVSERAFQIEHGGQWAKGKGCDTFAPMGPFLATKNEISDVHSLRLWLKLNGKTLQDSNTSDFIFNIPFVVSYLSKFMTLLPGDVISTGTPAGVGLGLKPPVYLKPGDVLELGIDGLGSSKQVCEAYKKN